MTSPPTFPLITDRPVRTVVVGYGGAGRMFHCHLIRKATPGLVLHGVVARTPEVRAKAEAEQRVKAYESVEACFADPAVDLVVLATPHATHAPLAGAALDAGKHVVTDKAMCLNLEECDAMIEAAKRNNRLLTVFHNRRFDGDYLTLRKLLADGALGDCRWIETSWQRFGAWGKWRASRAMGGGRLLDLGVHLLDQLLQIFPQPVETVFCRMHADWPGVEVESHCLVTIQFEGGATASVDVNTMNRAPKPRYLAIGPAGTWVKSGEDPQEPAMKAGDIDAAVEDPKHYGKLVTEKGESAVPTIPGRWRTYYENVAAALQKGEPPLVKLAEMRRLMAVVDAAFESARTGAAIRPLVR